MKLEYSNSYKRDWADRIMAEDLIEKIIGRLKEQDAKLWERFEPIYDISKLGVPVKLTFKTIVDGKEYLLQRKCEATTRGICWTYSIGLGENYMEESCFESDKKQGPIEKLYNHVEGKLSELYRLQREEEWKAYCERSKGARKQEIIKGEERVR